MNLVKLAGMNFDENLADPEVTSEAVKRAENSASKMSAGQAENTPSAAAGGNVTEGPSSVPVAETTAPPVAVVSEPAPVATQEPAGTPEDGSETIAAENLVAENGMIPAVAEEYMTIPKGEPIEKDAENPDVGRSEGPAQHAMSSMTKEQFENDMLALQQGAVSSVPSWIQRPDIWPPFIEFPTKRDLAAIQAAEDSGDLDEKAKENFNEHFARLSILMQMRSEQLDQWIIGENKILDEGRIKTTTYFSSSIRRNLRSLTQERAKAARLDDGSVVRPVDPFHDIKWAVALDPYASTDDPRFAFVSRWGHSSLETFDGGTVTATDDEIYVPSGKAATAQAAQIMVQEAIERGWTYLDVNTDVSFGRELKAACQKAGLGAKISYGSFGLSLKKAEYIMPNPPKLSIARGEDAGAKVAHQKLSGEDGKAPAEEAGRPSNTGQSHAVKTGAKPSKSDVSKSHEQLVGNDGKAPSGGDVTPPFQEGQGEPGKNADKDVAEPHL